MAIGCPECGDWYWDRQAGEPCPQCPDELLIEFRPDDGSALSEAERELDEDCPKNTTLGRATEPR